MRLQMEQKLELLRQQKMEQLKYQVSLVKFIYLTVTCCMQKCVSFKMGFLKFFDSLLVLVFLTS